MKVFPLFAAGIDDTSGIGGKFAAVLLIPLENLQPVKLTPVVDLDLQISPLIFEKFRNDPNAFIRDLGEDDSRKKLQEKNLV
jgi:hypothetical protein